MKGAFSVKNGRVEPRFSDTRLLRRVFFVPGESPWGPVIIYRLGGGAEDFGLNKVKFSRSNR